MLAYYDKIKPLPSNDRATNALGNLFAQEFLDLDTRDHGNSLPGAFLAQMVQPVQISQSTMTT